MSGTLRRKLSVFPSALSGLALAVAGLGWGMENALPLNGVGQEAGALLATLLLLPLFMKFILNPRVLWTELENPITGSTLPTFSMTLMLIARALGSWGIKNAIDCLNIASCLWLAAIAIHIGLLAAFIFHRCCKCDFNNMVPSWFIPPVGIVTAALTLPSTSLFGLGLFGLAQALLYIGIFNYALMLPIMLHRLIFGQELADSAKPTLAILAAPASLSLAACLSFPETPPLLLCLGLLGIATLMTSLVYLSLWKLLRLPFSPIYAAFTFPLVIGSTALYKVAALVGRYPQSTSYADILHTMATFELCVATLMTTYVAMRYVWHYSKKYRPAWNNANELESASQTIERPACSGVNC